MRGSWVSGLEGLLKSRVPGLIQTLRARVTGPGSHPTVRSWVSGLGPHLKSQFSGLFLSICSGKGQKNLY